MQQPGRSADGRSGPLPLGGAAPAQIAHRASAGPCPAPPARPKRVLMNLRMLSRYIREAMTRARYRILDDGTYFGEVPGLAGVWANARSLERCRSELQEVLEEWLLLKLRDNDPIPKLGRCDLRRAAA